MKSKIIFLLSAWLMLTHSQVFSQVVRQLQPPNAPNAPKFSNTKKTAVQSLTTPVLLTPNLSKEKKNWGVMLSQYGVSHGSEQTKSTTDSIKAALGIQKRLSVGKPSPNQSENDIAESSSVVDPYVTLDFQGNTHNGWTPTDNSIAVSDDGYIVSVVNSSLMFTTTDGTVLLEENFDSYLDFLNLSGSYFDPRVVYDPVEDKFIMVVLNGNFPGNSTVVIAFSTSNDPTESWWVYTFEGDPINAGVWFDYPSIGISTTEVFVSGNLFDSNDNFDQALIYEFEKGDGFAGQSLTGWYWDDVRDAYGNPDFTIVPISYGFNGSIGPGIFFISSNSGGGSDVMMYYTSDIGANNPTLEVFAANVSAYDLPINGYQLGSSDEIKTNDCRILSGYWADGLLHFVLNTQFTDLYTRIYYGRLNTNDLTSTIKRFGLTDYEYAFPAIAPFTNDETDATALIGFLRTGSNIYPQFRVVTCDDAGVFSGSVSVKGGDDYVDFSFNGEERWGDYSGISRRHLSDDLEVWVSGSFGAAFDGGSSNVLGTWIGRVSDDFLLAPFVDFVANQTVITAGQQVQFTDLSVGSPTAWSWSFQGGTPSSSTQQNPAVTYNTPGTYNVTLIASNSAGSDDETKTAYIVVNPLVIAPVANFTANQTTITAGQQIQFTDLSTNTPTGWSWTFPGGTPSSSTQKNPLITYNTPGTYNVLLTASNNAGSDGETKASYIVVNPVVIAPVANFTANQTTITAGQQVQFTDLSTNGPTNWSWTFTGGTPSSSTQQNPTVTYNTPGVYNVSLTASNSMGNDVETKASYIVVSPVVIAPVANFTANQTTITAGQQVQFTDLSSNVPTSWSWTFPGGLPASSSAQNPTVTYSTPGTYNVSLTAGNGAGNDGETKNSYIVVNPVVLAPVSNFFASQTSITTGQQVTFTDVSTNSPIAWSWSFIGGSPSTSTQQNPVVSYNTPGTYSVTLISSNAAGGDEETKIAYITVTQPVQTPVADFSANVTQVNVGGVVQFTDLSLNAPTTWTWSFVGGTPNISTLQNPILVYGAAGVYPVTLVSSNTAGNSVITKDNYITVGMSAIQETGGVFNRFELFPNPVSHDRLNVVFEIEEKLELDFYILNEQGAVVKHLLHQRVKSGTNQLAFNTELLPSGTYFVLAQNPSKNVFKNAKFVVQD